MAETHERAIKFTAGVLGNMLLQDPRPDPHSSSLVPQIDPSVKLYTHGEGPY